MKVAKKKKLEEEYDKFGGNDFSFFEALIENEYGEDSIQYAHDLENPRANSTGSLKLDIALNVPIPEGRIIELFGGEGSGKTSVSLEILGAAQRQGKRVAYLNAERNLNRSLLDGIRTLDLEEKDDSDKPTCVILRGSSGEKCLSITEKFLAQFPSGVIVVDSVDALVPEAILQGNIGDATIGKLGKLMSESLRRITQIAEKNKSTVIFINQIRERPGVIYGNPETSPGGRALRFYSSQRIRFGSVPKANLIIDKETKDKIVGHWINFKIEKNKTAPPYEEGKIPLIYGKGIWRERELAELVTALGILETGGQGGKQLKVPNHGVMTQDKFARFLESYPEEYEKYLVQVKEYYEI